VTSRQGTGKSVTFFYSVSEILIPKSLSLSREILANIRDFSDWQNLLFKMYSYLIVFRCTSQKKFSYQAVHILHQIHAGGTRYTNPPSWASSDQMISKGMGRPEQREIPRLRICRLSWLTNSALVYEPKCGGSGVVAGSQPISTVQYSCTQEPR
jgi:hypothetical protein